MHRITRWTDDRGDTLQIAVCCLDAAWEPHAEVTSAVGPFDDPEAVLAAAVESAHALGGWRAHQLELDLA